MTRRHGQKLPRPVALDAVRRANRGELEKEALAQLLTGWIYVPRYRRIATEPQVFFEPDSLDAVDVAYFDCGLLTDAQYSHILRTARIRSDTEEGGE